MPLLCQVSKPLVLRCKATDKQGVDPGSHTQRHQWPRPSVSNPDSGPTLLQCCLVPSCSLASCTSQILLLHLSTCWGVGLAGRPRAGSRAGGLQGIHFCSRAQHRPPNVLPLSGIPSLWSFTPRTGVWLPWQVISWLSDILNCPSSSPP